MTTIIAFRNGSIYYNKHGKALAQITRGELLQLLTGVTILDSFIAVYESSHLMALRQTTNALKQIVKLDVFFNPCNLLFYEGLVCSRIKLYNSPRLLRPHTKYIRHHARSNNPLTRMLLYQVLQTPRPTTNAFQYKMAYNPQTLVP